MKRAFFIFHFSLFITVAFAQERKLYDFIVPRDGSIATAIRAANNRPNKEVRFRIFVMPGEHVFPADTSKMVMGGDSVMYPSPITYLRASNTSIIGVSFESTSITNTVPPATWHNGFNTASPLEGISKSDVLNIEKKVENTYMQGITIKTSMGDRHGRDIALNDNGNKTILKDCQLWGFQDTYVSHQQRRYYFEGGVIRGNTDFVCGKGDVWFNQVTLRTKGGYIAVPSKPLKYGYIFDRCTIISDGENGDGSFTLGRPWGEGTPIALWLNTTMMITPKPIGYDEMGKNGYPARFAEFNSRDAQGQPVDLSERKRTFRGHENCNNPVLSAEEAAQYSIEKVMGGDDGWNPLALTRQIPPVEKFRIKKGIMTWEDVPEALLYVIFRNGELFDFTLEPRFTLPADASRKDHWQIRCANQMGGF